MRMTTIIRFLLNVFETIPSEKPQTNRTIIASPCVAEKAASLRLRRTDFAESDVIDQFNRSVGSLDGVLS